MHAGRHCLGESSILLQIHLRSQHEYGFGAVAHLSRPPNCLYYIVCTDDAVSVHQTGGQCAEGAAHTAIYRLRGGATVKPAAVRRSRGIQDGSRFRSGGAKTILAALFLLPLRIRDPTAYELITEDIYQ